MLKRCWCTFLLSCIFLLPAAAQYEAKWESLDKKPIPEWYKDAKFGIFIHWGVYSVPAYAKVGGYAEWYQHKLRSDSGSPTALYHRKVYGDKSYYDLAPAFKAELFDPDAWAQLFERSGAKYVALTSKHHDGYALWPSKVGDRDWGFPWNATEVGPQRDLIKALFTALRKTDVKPGLYYSLYEWYNPLYLRNVDSFVTEHTLVQLKDLISNYQPYVLFTDGGWDHPATTWHAKDFLAWLYNDSVMKDSIVTYDRWGSGVRFKHGMVYTPEYQPGLTFDGHYFEESQGMGYSYGYNRAEDASDYSSGRLLTLQLIDIVSRGGNFLLDIGPRADGKIPAIMQERLLHIGRWLAINGAAIYGTRPWKSSCQWSGGLRDYTAKKGETLLLKQTIDPEPGYARKEMFFTRKGDRLFCILPLYPQERVVVQGINLPAQAKVTLLATGQSLRWQNQGTDLQIDVPPFQPDSFTATDAFVLEITHAPEAVAQPTLTTSYKSATADPVVTLRSTTAGAQIYYTLDGSLPDQTAKHYQAPFAVKKSDTVKAIAMKDGWVNSNMTTRFVRKYEWQQSQKVRHPRPGLHYRYYTPDTPTLDMSQNGPIVTEGTAASVSLDKKEQKEKFALDFQGYLKIAQNGIYTFFTTSDDGSDLWIDGIKVVDNGGPHGPVEVMGKIALKKGFHTFRVRYFDGSGDNSLKVSWQIGEKKTPLPAGVLFH